MGQCCIAAIFKAALQISTTAGMKAVLASRLFIFEPARSRLYKKVWETLQLL
jgi:hypothetical protein